MTGTPSTSSNCGGVCGDAGKCPGVCDDPLDYIIDLRADLAEIKDDILEIRQMLSEMTGTRRMFHVEPDYIPEDHPKPARVLGCHSKTSQGVVSIPPGKCPCSKVKRPDSAQNS